jgi:hypothetical protein
VEGENEKIILRRKRSNIKEEGKIGSPLSLAVN